jgi:sulfur carrier protein ThiS
MTMKIKVRLYGGLGNQFPDHDPLNGFEIQVPDASNVGDLLNILNIHKKKLGSVSVDGQLVKADKRLKEGCYVQIYRPIFGG